MKYDLDQDAQTISIRTKQLGSYIVSDTRIPNGTAVGGSSSGSAGNSGSGSDKGNPSTGGTDFTAIALALGSVSLAGAAAAVKYRRK